MIDVPLLEELRTVMGDDMAVLLQGFERDSVQRFDELEAAIRCADAETLRRTAHTMKGGALGVGATQFAARCKELEDCAKHGDIGAAERVLAPARQALSETMAALGAWL